MANDAGLWEGLKPADCKADGGGDPVAFIVVSREKRSGNRLARRDRPYRNGTKLDHVGNKEDEFSVVCVFHNAITEAGIGDDPPLWPDRLNALEAVLASDQVLTLNLPWERNIRCRADNWTRGAIPDVRDGESLTVTFIRDNEDNLDGAAVEHVSPRAVLNRAVDEAIFDAEREGVFVGESLSTAVRELQAALAAPGDFRNDIETQSRAVISSIESLQKAIADRRDGDAKGNDPATALFRQQLAEIRELAARSLDSANTGLPSYLERRFPALRNIFDIARELEQDASELIKLNPQIPDLGAIPAGTPVRVFTE
jgi:prophage DNA circulation protein